MYLPYVKHTLNSWATQNRIIPQDWKDRHRKLEAGIWPSVKVVNTVERGS